MTVEASPLGVKCNLRCTYCYENPMRDLMQYPEPDYALIKEGLLKHKKDFTLFGGEPLLIPLPKLEDLWRLGHEKYKKNGIQTNGSLITEKHVELFKKYNVHVGFSIDGPRELNDARSAPSNVLSATRNLTKRSNDNLLWLLREGVACSLIITLHRLNASREKLPALIAWMAELHEAGLKSVRLHFLENDDADNLMLEEDDLMDALVHLEVFTRSHEMDVDIFKEMKERLKSGQGGTCVYHECDPLNTAAVQGVGPRGEALNCGRVNKHGIDYLKTSRSAPTRSYILRNTPQEDGGCAGCELWYACKGNCPGTAIEGDWRNRTSYCSLLKKLFRYLSEVHNIEIKPELEVQRYNREHLDQHGDQHGDSNHIDSHTHGDTPHGDVEHGDKTFLGVVPVK